MEPSISPLAKRLAEENNVSWHLLEGSGPSGRVVERDVLEYLARVMSGEAATDPVLEPLPEGVDAWSEDVDDTLEYNMAGESAMKEDALEEALLDFDLFEDALEPPLAGGARAGLMDPEEDDLTEFDFASALSDDVFVTDDVEDVRADALEVGIHEAETYRADAVPEEIFFGDEAMCDERPEALFDASAETPTEDSGAFGTETFGTETFGTGIFETKTAGADEAVDAFDVGALEAEPLHAEAFDTGALEPEISEPEAHSSNVSPAETGADVFLSDTPADSAPDTPASRDDALGAESSTNFSGDNAFGRGFGDEVGVLDDGFSTEDVPGSRAEDDAFRFEGFEDASEGDAERAPAQDFFQSPTQEPGARVAGASATEHKSDFGGSDAPTLPTSDAPAPAPAQAGELPTGVPLAPYVLMRRHLDLTALLEAQRAVSLEVTGEVAPTAFLVRAALKALHKAPLTMPSLTSSDAGATVALALISGDALHIEKVSDTDASFESLLEAASVIKQDAAQEADAPADLIVADLSRYTLDEVVLNLGAPVLTLSRVGDAEGSQGALSLSGDVAPERGAEFLTCVAELLNSPVRLLL